METHNTDQVFQREISTAIKNKSDIVFITYSGIEDTENKIKFALAKILENFQKEDIFTPVLYPILDSLIDYLGTSQYFATYETQEFEKVNHYLISQNINLEKSKLQYHLDAIELKFKSLEIQKYC